MKMMFAEIFFLLTIITIIHELGHFLMAKYFKFNIKEFSIGSGFTIFEQKIKNTMLVLKLVLPLGGHIRVDFEVNKFKQMDDRKLLGIICVSLAGPFMNIIVALLTFQYNFAFAAMSFLTGITNLLPFDMTDGDIALGGIREYLKRRKEKA